MNLNLDPDESIIAGRGADLFERIQTMDAEGVVEAEASFKRAGCRRERA